MTSGEAVLELGDVTFRREGRQIIDGISLTVNTGEHWALLGPNGAGKSTVLGFCGALTHPTSGVVRVLGEQLGHVELQQLRKHIGHVNPRHPLRSPLTALEVVLTGITGTIDVPPRWSSTPEDRSRAEHLLDTLGIAAKADLGWPVLSQGERGRLLIARALIIRPSLLLLDEPTTGLDVAAREQLLETLDLLAHTDPQLASVLVTHHLEELPETTTHAQLMSHGRTVATGAICDVLTTGNVTRAFEHPIRVDYERGRWSARADRRQRVA